MTASERLSGDQSTDSPLTLADGLSLRHDGDLDAMGRTAMLEAMTEAVPVGIVITDASGKIIHGNKCVEEMVRHPVLFSNDADSYGEWISYHADGTKVASEEYPLARIIKGGEDHAQLEVHYQRGDKTMFWMRIIGKSVRGADNKLLGATVALIDVDEEIMLRQSQEILIGELNHRVKNAFSVTMAIVRRSLGGTNVSADVMAAIAARLQAYAMVHSQLVGTKWGFASLRQVAQDVLQPIAGEHLELAGPEVKISSQTGISLSMAFYELVTNASKYGALSVEGGKILLGWDIDREKSPEEVTMRWRETGGPDVADTTAEGFGTFITQRAVAAQTNGTVTALYKRTGLEWTLKMPLPSKMS
ncbi:sensor histidine kinase [Altererythrobacter aquiaggeris]|uniref:sensor histidine kinase n=1 Tax=Aestuarierythrobacter aquiaggeris TaxID=1898396 RepID=UPI003017816C